MLMFMFIGEWNGESWPAEVGMEDDAAMDMVVLPLALVELLARVALVYMLLTPLLCGDDCAADA